MRFRKRLKQVYAALDPHWNARNGYRPVNDSCHLVDNPLPPEVRDVLSWLEFVTGGMAVVQGGALIDLQMGKTPKDFDTNVVCALHPFVARRRIIMAAKRQGYGIEHYPWHVNALWKRVKLYTSAGLFDLSCLKGPLPLELFACDPDVSTCAQAATATHAIATTRHLDGEARQCLIFRPTVHDRDRKRHPKRWFKYAVEKYPERPVEYQCPQDAVEFARLQKRRADVQRIYERQLAAGIYRKL